MRVILTGSEIESEWSRGRITIDPFMPEQVNPNSYNFRLGRTLRIYQKLPLDPHVSNESREIEIPDEGYVLEPGRLYLGHTIEVLGSDYYAPTFAARSSIARLGIFINLSASLGDIGYKGQWTLQLYSAHRVRVYPGINIGQMMWWQPQGEVVLYEGKYQGAAGPRSSDIHIDFDKQIARQRFPGLGSSVDRADVGGKFAALAASSRQYPVPAAFCVPAGEFVDAMSAELAEELRLAFDDLKATVGAFYAESVAHIQEVGTQVQFPGNAQNLIRLRMKEIFGDISGLRFAVRSSGLDEDDAASSLAGVHRSLLDVEGVEGVTAAIGQCWASYYEAPAVAARVRAGDYRPGPRLAVIVQVMVKPVLAGVAFTGLDDQHPDTVVLEYVSGRADELVAGVAIPVRCDSGDLPDPVLSPVVEMARALRDQHGHHVDVEWAVDASGPHLIQVRPLTATMNRLVASPEPVARVSSLYFDDLPADFGLGEVAPVYGGYVTKRGPAYRMAAADGVATGAGWVVQFNGLGLRDEECLTRIRAELAAGGADRCVLDLGETLRQIVVPKDDVPSRLAELLAARPDGRRLYAAVVRDFIQGELGVVSRLAGSRLIVEYTDKGLMELNRGTAGADSIVLPDLSRPQELIATETATPLLPHLAKLTRLTSTMQAAHGAVTLEWVLADGELYFIDYSALGTESGSRLFSADGTVLISPGTARGPLVRLDEDEMLRRLSIGPAVSVSKSVNVSEYDGVARIIDKISSLAERPIVHTSRPYAVLSILIGHVAGFVFDEGSALGHLAILLREAGVPAVAAKGFAGTGEAVISDGKVIVTRQEER
jgi:rifampicin phosphotransferase